MMEWGIIGNNQYSALIDRFANVAWMCWPRFDSSFVFGSLLDREKAGHFSVQPEPMQQGEQHYIPNTNILSTTFSTHRGSFEVIDFAPKSEQDQSLLHPHLLIRILRPLSGTPHVRVTCEPTYDYAKQKITSRRESGILHFKGFPQEVQLRSNLDLDCIQHAQEVPLTETSYLCLSWGDSADLVSEDLGAFCEDAYQKTEQYWKRWVDGCKLPTHFREEVIRSALALKLHHYEPTGAITAATTTSLPECNNSGRNWDYRFCWPRDAFFTAETFLRLGKVEEVKSYTNYLLRILDTDVENRFQPIYGIDGERDLTEEVTEHLEGYQQNLPIRIGNAAYNQIQNDLYGQLIMSLAPRFLNAQLRTEETTLPTALLHDLLAQIEQRMEEPDAGLWELRTMIQLHSFSLLMHWKGAKTVQQIAEHHQWPTLKAKAEALAQRARQLLEERCWNEEVGAYMGDVTRTHVDGSLYMLLSWGFHDRQHPRAERHLRALEDALSGNKKLMYRYKHEDDFGKPKTSFTICSFWYAEALAHTGHTEEAKHCFEFYVSCANHLGLLSEDIDEHTLDLWGNFPQAYSHVGLINAALQISENLDRESKD